MENTPGDPITILLDKDGPRIGLDLQAGCIPEPDFRIRLDYLPSLNDYLAAGKNWRQLLAFKRRWHEAGLSAALTAALEQGLEVGESVTHGSARSEKMMAKPRRILTTAVGSPCEMILRVWRPTFGIWDTFNPFTKPIIDGFVEANVIADDNCYVVRRNSVVFMGVDPSLKPNNEERAARRAFKRGRKVRLPSRARFWFDFYELSRIASVDRTL